MKLQYHKQQQQRIQTSVYTDRQQRAAEADSDDVLMHNDVVSDDTDVLSKSEASSNLACTTEQI